MGIIRWVAKVFVVINSNTRPMQVGMGIAFGFLLGLIPFLLPAAPPINLLWLIIFLIAFLLKSNQAFQALFIFIIKMVVPLLYPLTSVIGHAILTFPALHGVFTSLNNIPVVPFTFFNSTLVMGGLALGLICFVPLTLGAMALLKLYRDRLREKIANSKLVKGFQKLPLVNKLGKAVSFYQRIRA